MNIRNKVLTAGAILVLGASLLGANTFVNGLTSVNLTAWNGTTIGLDGNGYPFVDIGSGAVTVIPGVTPWPVTTPAPCPTNADGGCNVHVVGPNPLPVTTPAPAPTYSVATPENVIEQAPTPTTTTVANSTSSVLLLAANPNRKGFVICNEDNAVLTTSYVSPASAITDVQDYSKSPSAPWDCIPSSLPTYTGAVYGIWATSVAGNAVITSIQ